MGLANDYSAARHTHLPHHTPALSAAQPVHGDTPVGEKRQEVDRRRVAVRRIGYRPGSHHRHRQHRGRGYGSGIRRSGSSAVVLADRCFRHSHKIWRGSAGNKIPHQVSRRPHDGRPDVCLGARSGHEMACRVLCSVHGSDLLRHRQLGAGQCHSHPWLRHLRHQSCRDWSRGGPCDGCRHPRRSEEHRPSMRYAGACYGHTLCHRLLLYPRLKQRIHLACDTDYSRECLLSRGGRWRTGWQRHNDSRTLRHSPGPVFQRVGTGFGSHRGSRSTDSQPGEAGTGVIERHFLGHGDNLRPHRTGHREQHTGLSIPR